MHRNSFFDYIQNHIVFVLFGHISDLLGDRVTFVEVGAFDGITVSNIHPHATNRGWTGLVIEPAPEPFEKLKQTYRDFPGILPLQIAINQIDGPMQFFSVRSNEGGWEGMLSSSDRDLIVAQKSTVADIEERLTATTVEGKTLATVCREHGISHLDLLMVDAEGIDDAVVQSLDFAEVKPLLIMFEHKHIPNGRLQALDGILLDLDYERICLWLDTIYIRKPMSDEECIRRLIDHAARLFPSGRDPQWGNGAWCFPPAGAQDLGDAH